MTFPKILLGFYLLLFIGLGIQPYDRAVWFAENLPIVMIVVSLCIISRYYVFSKASYILMGFLIVLHTIGGHYTFERVPFDYINQFFESGRNHYDRFAHFSVGFYAYAIAEWMMNKRTVRSKAILFLFPIFAIFSVAALYEIFEWQYAIMADEEAGIAVLGSQGDIWDAQKDMLADGMGAILSTIAFFVVYCKSMKKKLSN